jgi:hypothetical protein
MLSNDMSVNQNVALPTQLHLSEPVRAQENAENTNLKSIKRAGALVAVVVVVVAIAVPCAVLLPRKHKDAIVAVSGTPTPVYYDNQLVVVSMKLSGMSKAEMDRKENQDAFKKCLSTSLGLNVEPEDVSITRTSDARRVVSKRILLQMTKYVAIDAEIGIQLSSFISTAISRLNTSSFANDLLSEFKKDPAFVNVAILTITASLKNAAPPPTTLSPVQTPIPAAATFRRRTFAEASASAVIAGTSATDPCTTMAAMLGYDPALASGIPSGSFARQEEHWSQPVDYCSYCACNAGGDSRGELYTMVVASSSDAPPAGAASPSAAPAASAPAAAPGGAAGTAAADFTGTNNQVEGVDEADVIKTDGTYLYILPQSRSHLVIARAFPVARAEVLSRTPLRPAGLLGSDLLLAGDMLVLFGSATYAPREPKEPPASGFAAAVAQVWSTYALCVILCCVILYIYIL